MKFADCSPCRKPYLKLWNKRNSHGAENIWSLFCQQADGQRSLRISIFAGETEPTSISSAHIYILLLMAREQIAKDSTDNLQSTEIIEVRLLSIQATQMRIYTAKTTRAYITSIFEPRGRLEGYMELVQTPFFDFTQPTALTQLLMFTFESTTLIPVMQKRKGSCDDIDLVPSSKRSKVAIETKMDPKESLSRMG